MLIRDPYFQLYLLHVAALFVLALWPRISQGRQPEPLPQPLALSPVEPSRSSLPGMVRSWTLGPSRRDRFRFQELEATWSAECSARFSHVLERISAA